MGGVIEDRLLEQGHDLHEHGGEAHPENLGNQALFHTDAVDTDVLTFGAEVPQHRRRVDDLGDDRRVSGSLNSHSMRFEDGNQNGVENDIQNSRAAAVYHGLFEKPLAPHNHIGGLGEVDKQAAREDNPQIAFGVVQNRALRTAQSQNRAGKNHPQDCNNHSEDQVQRDQVAHDLVNGSLVLLSHRSGQDRSRPDADQCGNARVNQGKRVGNGNRSHSHLVDQLAHEYPVHEAVQPDHNHADNRRKAQGEHQLKRRRGQKLCAGVCFWCHHQYLLCD